MSDPSSDSFAVPCGDCKVETEVKKSRFIACAGFADSREKAMALLDKARQDYPDARHHCWAYIIENGRSAAASDDGEPSGTAGKPILNVLQHKHLSEIMVVVVRYFGGIKLGAGGLVRAYSGATQAVINELVVQVPEKYEDLVVECAFAHEAQLRYLVERYGGRMGQVDYSVVVTAKISIPAGALDAWNEDTQRVVTVIPEN